MTHHYPYPGSACDWLKQISHATQPIRSTTQNFCADLSDVISHENQWWHHEMTAVFSGYQYNVNETKSHVRLAVPSIVCCATW